jgi:hypothetical protein
MHQFPWMRTVGDDGARGRRDVELRRESMPCVSASVTPELSPEQAVPHLLRDVLEHGRERGLLRDVHPAPARSVSATEPAIPSAKAHAYTRYGSLGSDVSVTLNVTLPDLAPAAASRGLDALEYGAKACGERHGGGETRIALTWWCVSPVVFLWATESEAREWTNTVNDRTIISSKCQPNSQKATEKSI